LCSGEVSRSRMIAIFILTGGLDAPLNLKLCNPAGKYPAD
jgi:hypothetical protein